MISGLQDVFRRKIKKTKRIILNWIRSGSKPKPKQTDRTNVSLRKKKKIQQKKPTTKKPTNNKHIARAHKEGVEVSKKK